MSIFKILLLTYTKYYKNKFYSFGKGSIIKPILNISNPGYISIGKNVDIGAFNRITVSSEYGGKKCDSKNKIRIVIEDNVDIGNNSFISANNFIKIGFNTIFSSYVFITDHDHGFDNIKKNLCEQPLSEKGEVIIEDNVFLGTKCSILKNVKIGRHSVVGANTVVTKNVPPYSMIVGNPAKIIKRYDFKRKGWFSI